MDNNSKLKLEIDEFKPPVLKTKLKTNYNLLYWRVRKLAYDLPLKYIINSRKAKKSLIDSSAILFVCFLLPDVTSAERLITLIECMCTFLFVDDYMGFEKSEKGFKNLIAVINGTKEAESPTEIYLSLVFGKIRRYYTNEQYNYLIKKFYEYFVYCKNEMNLEEKHRDSIDKILSSKFNTNGTKAWYALIEYGLDIKVNRYRCDKRLQKYAHLSNIHNSYVNDIFSLKKECKNNDLKFNTIYQYYKNGNSIEKSVQILIQKLEDIEDEMLKLKNILENDSSKDIELIAFMDAIEYNCSGNLMWSMFTPRYNVYNKLAINHIFGEFNQFCELRDEFDSNTFNHEWNYSYV